MRLSVRSRAVTAKARAATRIAHGIDKVTGRVAGSAQRGGADRSAADLVIADLLARHPAERRNDPVRLISFLRDCFEARRFHVSEIKADDSAPDPASLRFQTLTASLAEGAPAIPDDVAMRIATAADGILGRREPFERPHWSADVGLHAQLASSFGHKGRLLTAAVRFARPESVLEIGTAYGLSALFLAAGLPEDGRLVTLERSRPQVDVAREVLAGDERIEVMEAISHEAGGDIRRTFDLLFHDAEHSEEAYVRDFETFEPMLRPGAVVLFDDIEWEDPLAPGDARTYRGWRQVVEHARVRRALEIDGTFGLLLLR